MTLRVLQSFDAEAAPRNPYMAQLVEALRREGVSTRTFDWQLAMRADYDILHLHWPENLLLGRGTLYTWRRRAAMLALLARCRRDRIAIVRTVHNERPHEGASPSDRRILDLVDRSTDAWIVLNPQTRVPYPGDTALIPHGHYRDWYREYHVPARVAGRLLFFGLVRRYKAVPELLRTFEGVADPELSLRVCGKAKDQQLQEELETLASRDRRVSLRLERISDEELAEEIGEAELAVLPYAEMHNSGAVLLALSLGRPVLVPDSPVAQELGAEVGPAWVLRYQLPLDAADIEGALAQARGLASGDAPDLERRDWAQAGRAHARVYQQAARRERSSARP